MKKFLATILAIVYLTTTTGAAVHMHYCMGNLVENNLWHDAEEQCSKCGMDKTEANDDGCCNDEHKQVKLDVDHQLTTAAFDYLQSVTIAEPVSFVEIPAINFSSIAEENPNSNAPPRSCGIAIFKRNCVFLI